MDKFNDFIDITIQDKTGDRKLRLSWDNSDNESAKAAQEKMKELFIELKNNGYRFFSVKKVLGLFNKKGEEIHFYDAKDGELIYEKDPNFVMKESLNPEKEEPVSTESLNINEEEPENKILQFPVEVEEKRFSLLEHLRDDNEKNHKFEDPKKFDPEKDNFTEERSYLASKPLRAG